MGPITYHMRQFINGERNFILAQSLLKMLQNQDDSNCNRQDQCLKIREIIESDSRYTICDIAKAVGITL